ncbi:very-short-patch-repair endonuclease [Pseudonocardia endophytica]|uniref:Very-short-patch-repair endonuclease n=1 Tax=Pseudonocardia endophytica TaxID=401976 RepID=A0A4R1HJY9_PSEEN|nr:very-short-patch-repair endonuclease [Pseudonocardia endophytica]
MLARQHGVVSRSQAVGCGLSVRTVRRRVLTGRWREPLPGVYLVDGHTFDDTARVWAAALWAGRDGVVSGPAAAYWSGLLDRAPPVVTITLPRSTTRPSRDLVRVRRRNLDPIDRTVRRGVAVTAVPLTVLETAAVLPDGETFLDRVLQRRKVTFAQLHAAYCRAEGARGMGRAGELLVAAGVGVDSTLERRLVALLRRAGLDGFVPRYPFGDTRVDLAFPDERVAVEIDSWAWHTDPARFAADRDKGNALALAGWTVLRFTWRDITRRPERVVARIRAALHR